MLLDRIRWFVRFALGLITQWFTPPSSAGIFG
ncbi:hypothetical protein A2U01_0079157 [Trifolium medium]|uniref:Uncharacterized protein n=1 Tax=Trifolium medium TaxID=97028 RepID=A0A392TCN9_9FABA|nr:hypothetical protein [Trifolium medium]